MSTFTEFLGKESNFNKARANLVTDFGVPYDYQSIMHYRRLVCTLSIF